MRGLLGLPYELKYGSDKRDQQSERDHNEHADHVFKVKLRRVLFVVGRVAADVRLVLDRPPSRVELMQVAALLQLEYGVRDLVAPDGARWSADAVAFRVEQAANLHEIAVPLSHILVCGRLEQIGIFLFLDAFNAFSGRLDKVTRVAAHKTPHSFIGLNHRFLQIILYRLLSTNYKQR